MGASRAGVEDIAFPEAQFTEEPNVGRPEVEERLSGPAGGLGEPSGVRNTDMPRFVRSGACPPFLAFGDMYSRYVSPFLKYGRGESRPLEGLPDLRPDLVAGGPDAGA